MAQKTITYVYQGLVERGSDYHLVEGYAEITPEGHVLYPWGTYRECQRDARERGAKAVFIRA